jgi:magnesium-transporting ATPase (P-type)
MVFFFELLQLYVKINVALISACVDIPASYLAPGDVMIPSYGCAMACDAVLWTGNCTVNESMLIVMMIPCLCYVAL